MPVIAVESQVELDVLKKKSLEAAAAGTGMPRGWDAVNAFQAEEFGKELKKVKAAPARPRARAPAGTQARRPHTLIMRRTSIRKPTLNPEPCSRNSGCAKCQGGELYNRRVQPRNECFALSISKGLNSRRLRTSHVYSRVLGSC